MKDKLIYLALVVAIVLSGFFLYEVYYNATQRVYLNCFSNISVYDDNELSIDSTATEKDSMKIINKNTTLN